jgi:zinc transport system ATP-binding protein
MFHAIQVDDVSFQYADEPVFSRIDFSVYRGDFMALIGSNGAGKSTLFRLILGELVPSAGRIRLFEQDVRRFRDWAKIGYLAQNGLASGANFPATVEEIVTANLFSQIGFLRFPRKAHRKKSEAALRQVGMEGYGGRPIGSLSSGQRQRAMLARVLVSEPELLLLDEPTTGVDVETIGVLFELLARLNRESGLTVMMITHDVARASNYASRTLCLEDGSLVELDKARLMEELAHKHRHPPANGRTRREGADGYGDSGI